MLDPGRGGGRTQFATRFLGLKDGERRSIDSLHKNKVLND